MSFRGDYWAHLLYLRPVVTGRDVAFAPVKQGFCLPTIGLMFVASER